MTLKTTTITTAFLFFFSSIKFIFIMFTILTLSRSYPPFTFSPFPFAPNKGHSDIPNSTNSGCNVRLHFHSYKHPHSDRISYYIANNTLCVSTATRLPTNALWRTIAVYCTYIHIYIYTYIYTHIYIYIYMLCGQNANSWRLKQVTRPVRTVA
jgi:hypothetical protein